MAITEISGYPNARAADNAKNGGKAGNETRDYLSRLKEKYPDVNITVADFKNERQEDGYMFGCSGGNNVVISSDIIRKMASDPETAAKYEKIIEEAPEAARIIKDGLASYGSEMIACGTAVDKNGRVTYWSISRHKPREDEGKKISDKKSAAEKLKEKREKKKSEEAAKQKRLEKSETLEKLLKKFRDKAREIADGTFAVGGKNGGEEKGDQLDMRV